MNTLPLTHSARPPRFETLEGRALLAATFPAVSRPTIQSLSVSPAAVTQGADLTLVAQGAAAGGPGTIAAVEFYRDADGDARFNRSTDVWVGSDRSPRRGWRTGFPTADMPGGTCAFFARVRDSSGNVSKPAAASATVFAPLALVANYRGAVTFAGDGQDSLLIRVTRQKNGHLWGTLEQVGAGLTFDFAGDLGRNNTFTLTFSGAAGDGSAKGTITADGRRMSGTFTSHVDAGTFTGTFGVKRYRASQA